MTAMRKLYYEIYIIYLALRFIGRPILGSQIVFRGRRYTINNGTVPGRWDLVGGVKAPRCECSLVLTPSNIWHSFSAMRRFYRTSWLSIWVRKGIAPWMLACNIWPEGKRHG